MARQKELDLDGGFPREYYTIKIEYCQLLALVIKLESFFFFSFFYSFLEEVLPPLSACVAQLDRATAL